MICTSKKECKRCRRRLDDHSFADANTCKSCARRYRSAFHEVSISTSPDVTTFETFVVHNSDVISDIFAEALKEHRLVVYLYHSKQKMLNVVYRMIVLKKG